MALGKDIEKEAKEFTAHKKKPRQTVTHKALTPRQQLAGMVLSGLLQGRRSGNTGDTLYEAFAWADLLLDYDK